MMLFQVPYDFRPYGIYCLPGRFHNDFHISSLVDDRMNNTAYKSVWKLLQIVYVVEHLFFFYGDHRPAPKVYFPLISLDKFSIS